MILRLLQITLITGLLAGCFASLSPIEKASVSYKQNKDYASLLEIYNQLFEGMQRKEVERLLGEPDNSLIDGQYYYSSDRTRPVSGMLPEVPVGLVIDYRDGKGVITERLQKYWFAGFIK